MVLSYLVSYLELNRSWWQILSWYGKIYMEVEIRKYYVVWFSLAQLFVLILLLLCPELCNRFKEGAELLSVCWLEIHGKILSKMLSRNTNYAAYLVYRIADRSYGLDSHSRRHQSASEEAQQPAKLAALNGGSSEDAPMRLFLQRI